MLILLIHTNKQYGTAFLGKLRVDSIFNKLCAFDGDPKVQYPSSYACHYALISARLK